MTPSRVFDIAMIVGSLLASVGAGMQWGLPVGLMTMGGLIIAIGFGEALLLT